MCNEAVNNYFYQGNTALLPNGSLAEAPASSGQKHESVSSWRAAWFQRAAAIQICCRVFGSLFEFNYLCVRALKSPLWWGVGPSAAAWTQRLEVKMDGDPIFKVSKHLYNMEAVAVISYECLIQMWSEEYEWHQRPEQSPTKAAIAVCVCVSRMFLQWCISCAFICGPTRHVIIIFILLQTHKNSVPWWK